MSREVKALFEVAEALANLRAPFFFAGGWAIDLHLGRVTREHHDIDVVVMRRGHLGLHKALKQFSLKKIIPHPDGLANRGTVVDWPPGARLEMPVHQINAYRAGEAAPAFQVMLAESSDSEWIFRRNPNVRMPISRMGFRPLLGLPYLAPEIVLLFKAKYLEEERNRLDFKNVSPHLSGEARRWLRDVIEKTHPGHEWLNVL